MQTQQLTEQLKTLRLRGMASALEESLTALSQKKLAPTTWLAQLLQAEMADRQARSYEYQLRLARFPVSRDIDSFDFKESAIRRCDQRLLAPTAPLRDRCGGVLRSATILPSLHPPPVRANCRFHTTIGGLFELTYRFRVLAKDGPLAKAFTATRTITVLCRNAECRADPEKL